LPNKCADNIICFSCSGNHVISVCPVKLNEKFETESRPSTSDESIAIGTSTVVHSGNLMLNSRDQSSNNEKIKYTTVSLPSLKIPVVHKLNNVNNSYNKLNVLLDQGSMRSFILRDVAKRMNLKTVGKENLSISTLTNRSVKCDYEIVKVPIKRPGKNVDLLAVVVDKLPQIEEVKGLSQIINNLNHNFWMAEALDNTTSHKAINFELIVGGDYFYRIVNIHEKVIYKEGIHLLPTHFGYVVTGALPTVDKSTDHEILSSTVISKNISFQKGDRFPREQAEKLWLLDCIEHREVSASQTSSRSRRVNGRNTKNRRSSWIKKGLV
jgi:hypothetical protein